MDKQKVLEINKILLEVKTDAEKRKLREDMRKQLDEEYDFQSVNIDEIREKVYEEERKKENAGIDALSWFAKK